MSLLLLFSGIKFDDIRQDIINGLDSAQAEAAGWDAKKALIPVSAVVRTSDTVVTITLPAIASYAITANETITATVPSTALAGGSAIVATPTIGIAADTDAATQAFLKESPVAYPILVDDPERGDLSLDYGNTRSVLPYTVLIGREGRVVAQHFGEFSESSLERWLAPHL